VCDETLADMVAQDVDLNPLVSPELVRTEAPVGDNDRQGVEPFRRVGLRAREAICSNSTYKRPQLVFPHSSFSVSMVP
jgi:hypothetical protein